MNEKPFVIVAWGDSIAANNGWPEQGWPAMCELTTAVVTSTGRRVTIRNEGVCGMPAAQAVLEFETRVKPHDPDLVFIQFGANDVRYEQGHGGRPLSTEVEFTQHMTAMIRACHEGTRARVIVFGYHRPRRHFRFPNGLTYQEAFARYNALAAEAAAACGAEFYDLSRALPYDDYEWKELVCEDGVHLSATGNHAYADFAANLILRCLQNKQSKGKA